MIEVDQFFAQAILQHPAFTEFWSEVGHPVVFPPDFKFIYEQDVGLFVVEPVDHFYGIHVAIYPEKRGIPAIDAGKKAIQWCLKERPKVLARIRKNQPKTSRYARKCGMRKYGENDTHVFYEAA